VEVLFDSARARRESRFDEALLMPDDVHLTPQHVRLPMSISPTRAVSATGYTQEQSAIIPARAYDEQRQNFGCQVSSRRYFVTNVPVPVECCRALQSSAVASKNE